MTQQIIQLEGKMTSKDVQVLSIKKGYPLCRFSFLTYNQKINVLLSKNLALRALYELRQHDRLRLDLAISSSGHYWLIDYQLQGSNYPFAKSFV